ncbi:MAG: tyrosine-type recombinase/integrase [Chloroflexi bacterium]|nr:tyrosine-type recombinase/integrase [Chloroflexota bacterium]MBV9547517.1 tyrosine-type recombinase/integrase [Chloroflexota bacterium]
MNGLREALDDYLAVRRALGFKLKNASYLLPKFVSYLEQSGATVVTTELALAWARQPAENPIQWCERLKAVRSFARHLQSLDPRCEVPAAYVLPVRRSRTSPYLYSKSDIAKLMQAARLLQPPLRAATYETLIGVLACTGLRVSEAIRLDCDDVDYENGVLIIRASKFGKSRAVALHPSTIAALQRYQRLRNELERRALTPSLFVNMRHARLAYRTVNHTYVGLVKHAEIRPSSAGHVRLHDLRHTFVVRTVLDWHHTGVDVQAKLPVLSTYVGHVDPKSTYWYLSAAPELLALAASRVEAALEVQP